MDSLPPDELAAFGHPFRYAEYRIDDLLRQPDTRPCDACHKAGVTFAVDRLLDPCESCGTLVARPEVNGALICCPTCGTTRFPEWKEDDAKGVCAPCLQAGRGAVAHSVTYFFVHPDSPGSGFADPWGEPPSDAPWPTVNLDDGFGEPLSGVAVPMDVMQELLRTPAIRSFQQENWQLHCGQVMTFLGRWTKSDFDVVAGGDGKPWFVRHAGEDDWKWNEVLVGNATTYVFRCQRCGLFRVKVDVG